MNNSIIKKCLDELQKETFRRDYVIGMLETLYDMSGQITTTQSNYPGSFAVHTSNTPVTSQTKQNEEIIPEYLTAGPIGNITTR